MGSRVKKKKQFDTPQFVGALVVISRVEEPLRVSLPLSS